MRLGKIQHSVGVAIANRGQIKDNLLKDVAMTVQMGFQRAKEERDGYSKEEKEQCRWALEELKRKYPSH